MNNNIWYLPLACMIMGKSYESDDLEELMLLDTKEAQDVHFAIMIGLIRYINEEISFEEFDSLYKNGLNTLTLEEQDRVDKLIRKLVKQILQNNDNNKERKR
ncbi:MAG: hypothetical protein GX951_05245 [Mollicutes bacterium]|nr:hypothetical protein [Mollicutes bacterium]